MANNLIQIKRSPSNATIPALANGELAFTSAGNTFWIGGADGLGNVRIGGQMVPGTLTANQALVANSTGFIDAVKTANLTVRSITANATSSPGAGYLLSVDGGGNTYWTNPATLTTAASGSNTQVQFNDSNAFGGSANFTYDKVTNTLYVANNVAVGNSTTTIAPQIKVANTLGTTTINTYGISTGNVYANSVGAYGNFTGQVNSATMYVSTSANVGTAFTVTASALTSTVNTTISGANLSVTGTNTYITSNTTITGITTVSGNVTFSGANVYINGTNTAITSNSTIGGSITNITSNTTLSGANVYITGTNTAITANSTFSGLVNITGANTYIQGTNTAITSNTTLSANLNVSGANVYINGTNTTIVSNTTVSGNFNATGGNHFVQGTNNYVSSNSTFAGSNSTFSSNVQLLGANVWIAGTNTAIASNTTFTANVNMTGANVYIAGTNTAITSNVTFGANATFLGANIQATNAYLNIRDVNVSGNLTVLGTLTTIDTVNLQVKDNFIKIADQNNLAASDAVDFGIFGVANTSSTTTYYGLGRVASGNYWQLFSTTTEPTSPGTIGAVTQGLLYTYLNSGALVSNAQTVTITANNTINVNITANSLSLSTPLQATSGGTGVNTYSAGDLLYAGAGNPSVLSKLSVPGSAANGQVLQITNNLPAYGTLDGGTF